MTTRHPKQSLHAKYMWNILDHKRLVARHVQRVANALFGRAVLHDYSKFGPEEFDAFAGNLPYFEAAEYGSEEYKVACERIRPAMQHHVTINRHHPEYFADGIEGMNLIDLVEMVCDWLAASQRVPGDKVHLDIQQVRFGIDPQLMRIIENTVAFLQSPRDEENL